MACWCLILFQHFTQNYCSFALSTSMFLTTLASKAATGGYAAEVLGGKVVKFKLGTVRL